MGYPYTPPFTHKFITVQIEDISTAGQKYVVPGFRGRIRKIWSVLNGAISGANAGLTVKITGTAVTGGTLTLAQSGSAAGDVDSAVPTGANTFVDGDVIEIETDGASTGAVAAAITLELEPI